MIILVPNHELINVEDLLRALMIKNAKVDDNRKIISHIVKFIDPEYIRNTKALNLIGAGKRKLKKQNVPAFLIFQNLGLGNYFHFRILNVFYRLKFRLTGDEEHVLTGVWAGLFEINCGLSDAVNDPPLFSGAAVD